MVILADKQDITRAGMMFLLDQAGQGSWKDAYDKPGLMALLREYSNAVVVLDYTLFDFDSVDEMLIIAERFPKSHWLLFSEELSADFLRMVLTSSNQFSAMMKDSTMGEMRQAISYALRHERFVSQHATQILLSAQPQQETHDDINLTKTEKEILIDIAHGLTTKEIADKRVSSFHTVNTHRKNIFRKLGVNNLHEATKYAIRAGLVDTSEYYI
jgi:DNA-binding NarL/FixJ family response regulator